MSTIDEVAFLAKVSVATVSRVINNNTNVAPETKERVLNAIARLKYQPNAMGSLLRKEHTGMILILLHSVDNPFFSPIVQGIEYFAQSNGMNVLICTTYGDKTREKHYLDLLKSHFVDGLLLITNTLTCEELNELNRNYPVVQVVEYLPGCDASFFSIDFYKATISLIDRLIEKGHQQIAFVHAGLSDIVSTKKKYQAYCDVLRKHKLEPIVDENSEHVFGYESGRTITRDLLKKNPSITAFFATSDLIACGIMDELKDQGFRVPQDKAVISFDNTIFSTIVQPHLTSVDVNGFQLGYQSLEYLKKRINDKKFTEKIEVYLPYVIHERESS
jgi:LacI family repressor for deo operon, udp, cdd, tsx, nupC, and nupG